eukprot:3081754-Amphidinium_carterae.1
MATTTTTAEKTTTTTAFTFADFSVATRCPPWICCGKAQLAKHFHVYEACHATKLENLAVEQQIRISIHLELCNSKMFHAVQLLWVSKEEVFGHV